MAKLSVARVLLASSLFGLAALGNPTPAASGEAATCTGTIASLNDVTNAVKCTTVVINSFTVPAGQTFNLPLATGSTVTMNGDVTFGNETWAGPLFQVSGKNIYFNGNGHTFNGNGPYYWDGQGGNGGVTKPAPMMKIEISGTYTNVKVLNSPERAYSVSNPAPLVMSNLIVDNSLGDQPNSNSGGKAAGHNTDGFDVSTTDLTIQDSTVKNQDDCLAINKGSNIVFQRNTCSGGHGISIGSIKSGVTVSGVIIQNNTITNNDQALRIKTDSDATNAIVTNVTYSGNTATGIREYGVLIDQSYPDTLGTPGTGCIISNISFIGTKTTVAVNSGAERVAVNCGQGACTGSWNWALLSVSGGTAGEILNFSGISAYKQ